MINETIYWTTRDGSKIDVDAMSTGHLRNVLKMIIRQNPPQINKTDNIGMAFSDEEIKHITEKSEYEIMNQNNYWK